VAVHDASGSSAVADAMRFRAGHEDARPDVSAALQRMAFVPLEVKAKCVIDYEACAQPLMRVCGACGLRDPSDKCVVKVDLTEVPPNHWLWLRVPKNALERLRARPDLVLLKLSGGRGGVGGVSVGGVGVGDCGTSDCGVGGGAGCGVWSWWAPHFFTALIPHSPLKLLFDEKSIGLDPHPIGNYLPLGTKHINTTHFSHRSRVWRHI